jgi:hypothetical protein
MDFLQRCVESFRRVNLADQASGRIYLRIESGAPVWKDSAAMQAAASSPDTLAGIRRVAPDAICAKLPDAQRAEYLSAEDGSRLPTLGSWGR